MKKMKEGTLNTHVILSGAKLRPPQRTKFCGVEGSQAVGQSSEPQESTLLRCHPERSSFRRRRNERSRRIAWLQPDPSTPQNSAVAPFSPAQDDNLRLRLRRLVGCVALLGLFAFTGCDNPIQTAYTEQIVVDGFIYANEPVDSIVLHRTTPFGAYYDDLDYAIDSAMVTITVDGMAHTLLPTGMKGRYYLPASDLIVQGGKTYNLTITAPNNQNLSATTTVPMPIHFSAIADSVRGKTFILDTNNLSNFAFVVTAGPADEPNRENLLSVTALDTTYGLIRHREGSDSLATMRYSNLATGPAIAITARLFNWYGPNLITFYAIDTNWTDYQRQVLGRGGSDYQPTLNHITGGIGVFGSAARDTVTIFVKPKS